MNCWNELLDHLAEVPRENGTPALHQSAAYLVEAFRAAGIEARKSPAGMPSRCNRYEPATDCTVRQEAGE